MRARLPILAALLCSTVVACVGRASLGGGGGGGGLPGTSSSYEPLPGLVAAAGGPSEVRVDWNRPGPGFELALFLSPQRETVYDGPPAAEGLVGTSAIIGGQANGTTVFAGLGIRAVGAVDYAPTGNVLCVRPDDPIYVDAAASPTGADGTTPQSAYPDPATALLIAFLRGGGTVWIRSGTYDVNALQLFAGVHVHGGFGPAFDLATRDPLANPTDWNVVPGSVGVDVRGGEPTAVVDGVRILGNAAGLVGVDVNESALELRSVEIREMADRGIRLRNPTNADCFDVRLSRVFVELCGADGLSSSGAFDLFLDGCRFESNVQEGIELDDLIALEGQQATLRISGCLFLGNGSEGLDADLNAPFPPGPIGGRFLVEIRGCNFELNGIDGLLIDFDYEIAPTWFADVVVRECLARGNAGNGVRVDADAPGEIFLHRVLSSANGGDGIQVSSETSPGLAVVSASVAAGNLGAGIRATFGNRPLIATHCVVTGNFAGGVVSDTVRSGATSCVAFLQADPWTGTASVGSVVETDPLVGMFENAAEGFERVLSVAGAVITLDRPATFAGNAALEIADDGRARSASSVAGAEITLSDAPGAVRVPSTLFVFGPGASAAEDYHLPAGSPALGAGLASPGAPAVDAGVWGSPGSGEPGRADLEPEELFRVRATSPVLTAGLGAMEAIDISFSADLDPSSVVLDEVRAALDDGTEIPVTFHSAGDTITIDPPAGGWAPGPFRVELFRGLRSTDGHPLVSPLALPLTSP